MMKKLLVAVSLALAATSASANIVSGGLQISGNGTTPVIPSPGDGGWGPINTIPEGYYTTAITGTMKSLRNGVFTATYLGQVATYANRYLGLIGGRAMQGVNNPILGIGNTASVYAAAGSTVDFSFGQDNNGNGILDQTAFANGMTNTSVRGIGYFLNTLGLKDASGHVFDFLIGYNDTARVNQDFDDFVVGVRHVPLPAALPLLAAALGVFGLSRRKNKAQA